MVLQSVFRRHRAQQLRRLLQQHRAATRLQCWARLLLAQRHLRALRRCVAAVQLQRVFRGQRGRAVAVHLRQQRLVRRIMRWYHQQKRRYQFRQLLLLVDLLRRMLRLRRYFAGRVKAAVVFNFRKRQRRACIIQRYSTALFL